MSTLALVLAAVIFGAMTFFSFVVAPLVFVKVPEADAGRFVRSLFPIYYAVGAVGTGAAGLLVAGLWPGWVLLALAASFVLLQFGLMPAINRARDRGLAGDAAASRRFDRLHKSSVWANGGQLVALAVVLVALGLDL
ncbi:MAG: DUF4149 domain-containing protein [Pseudomonadota bacterium]